MFKWTALATAVMMLHPSVSDKDKEKDKPPTLPPVTMQEGKDVPQSPVVRLEHDGKLVCTAFWLGNGLFATAGHCYFDLSSPDDAPYTVTTDTGKRLDVSIATASDYNKDLPDYMVMHLEIEANDWVRQWVPVTLDCLYQPAEGDDVSAVGYPAANQGRTTTKGYVNGESRFIWGTYSIPTSMPVAGGHSGSPVSHDGKVFGILVARNLEQPEWSYVQQIIPVCNYLKELGYAPQVPQPTP